MKVITNSRRLILLILILLLHAECKCVPGTSNSTECDFITGQCSCVSGVGGRSCDQCLMGFWGYNVTDFTGKVHVLLSCFVL